MKIKNAGFSLIAGAMCLSVAHSAHAQATPPMTGSAAQMQRSLQNQFDRLFMLKAAQGNMAEVMTSQLALQRSRNPRVRQIAQHMIAEHGRANAELLRLTSAKRLPMPRFVGAMHTATHDHLSRLTGARFDQMYMAAQVEAHENSINLYQQELVQGRDRDALAYARRTLPVILRHTAMIYGTARAVNAPGIAERPQALTRVGAVGRGGSLAAVPASGGMHTHTHR